MIRHAAKVVNVVIHMQHLHKYAGLLACTHEVEFKNNIIFDDMKFFEGAGYMRSANSHKREKLNRGLIGPMYRVLNVLGAMNLVAWGIVAVEVYSILAVIAFFAMVLMWMVALTPPVAFSL
jgi:hypothetical protein